MSREVQALKPLVDEYAARLGAIVPSADPVEIRVAIDLRLWPELEWLEDGDLNEAMVAAAGPDAYVESEEEGPDYVLYCFGLDLEPLRALLSLTLGDEFLLTTEPVPPPLAPGTQLRVKRSREEHPSPKM